MKRIKLDIKAKFGVLIAVVLAAVALCGRSGIHANNGLNNHVKTLFGRDFDGMRTIADLNVQLGHVQDEAVNYTLTGEKDEAAELQERNQVIRKELAHLKGLSGQNPKQVKLINTELKLWPSFMADWDAGKYSAAQTGKSQNDIAGALDERMDPMKTAMEELAATNQARAQAGFDEAESLASSGKRLTVIMVIVAALL